MRALVPFLLIFLLSSCGMYSTSTDATGTGKTLETSSGTTVSAIENWTLPNGMKVHYLYNKKPESRLEIRLVVHAGSAHEKPGEEGIAHFVEHMVFNGTESFASGEVMKQLQLLGTGFGGDVNAYTSTDSTVYHMQIETKPETMEKAFHMISDFASKPLFLSKEVEKELGVVLAEKRERKGSDQKEMDEFFKVVFAGTNFGKPVIGTEQSILSFTSESVKKFWKTWYRPDRMELILVGDFEKKDVESLVQTYFAAIPATKTPMPEEPSHTWSSDPTWIEVTHPEVSEMSHTLFWRLPAFKTFTKEGIEGQVAEEVLVPIVEGRFRELASAHPLVFSSTGIVPILRVNKYAHALILQATFRSGHEEEGLRLFYEEYYRLVKFGVEENEFDFAKQQFLAQNQTHLTNISSIVSTQEADNITDSLIYEDKIWSIEEQIKRMIEVYESSTKDQMNVVLKDAFIPEKVFGSFLRNDKDVSLQEKAQVLFKEAAQANLSPYIFHEPRLELTKFEDKPLSTSETIESIQAKKMMLPNGVSLMTRHTDFDKDRILLRVNIQGGPLLTRDPHMEAFEEMYQFVGVQSLSRESLNMLLQKEQIHMRIIPDEGSLTLMIDAPSAALDTVVQLAYELTTKPTYGDMELKKLKEYFQSQEKAYVVDPDMHMQQRINELLFHFTNMKIFWNADQRNEITLEGIKKAEEGMLRSSQIEVLLMGSPAEEILQKKIANTFSTLEKKDPISFDLVSGKKPFPESHTEDIYMGAEPKTSVALRFPATNGESMHLLATYTLLGEILQTKLFDSLREGASGVYSPSVAHRIFPTRTMSYMMVNFQTDPLEVQKLLQVFWKTVQSIRKEGIQEADIARARLPMLAQISLAKKMNDYWIMTIGSRFHLLPIDYAEQLTIEVKKVTAEELNAAFRSSFVKEKMIQLLRYPQK